MTGFQDRASLCCPGSSEGQGGLGWSLLGIGERGEGPIQPGHQIAMREQVHAQQFPSRMSLSIWLNMLHDALTLSLLRSGKSESGNSPLPYTRIAQRNKLFWTRVTARPVNYGVA